jgi:NADPH-dependent F420 reductase
MRIAILGGTGDIGEAIVLRLAASTDHELVVGSRKAEKAEASTTKYEKTLAEHGEKVTITGGENAAAVMGAEVVIVAVPAYHLTDTIEAVADDLDGSVLVSPAVGMQRDNDGLHYNPPGTGSVTALAANTAPKNIPVVGAFHNLAAGRLGSLDEELGWDVPVVADDDEAKRTITSLVKEIEGLRPLDAGGISNASEVEAVTPLLINLATNNSSMHDLGVKFR